MFKCKCFILAKTLGVEGLSSIYFFIFLFDHIIPKSALGLCLFVAVV